MKSAQGSATRVSAIEIAERGAHKVFIDLYRACHHFPINAEEDIKRYCNRCCRPIPKNAWERRQALLAMACRELRRCKNSLSARKACQLVAERFDGTVIDRVNGKDILLRLSGQSLHRLNKTKLPQTGPFPPPPWAMADQQDDLLPPMLSARARAAQKDEAFIAEYRARHFKLDVEKTVLQFRERYARTGPIDWQERRIALVIATCVELDDVKQDLSGGQARALVSEKYCDAPLGVSEGTGHEVRLRLSSTCLFKWHKVGAHLPGGSPDALRMALHRCGRRKSQT